MHNSYNLFVKMDCAVPQVYSSK